MAIARTIEDKRIDWSYRQTHEKGQQIEPREKAVFTEENAVALMLFNDVIFLNAPWWNKDWPEEAKSTAILLVICNDVFAWGCSDAERLPYNQIESLYRMWRKDEEWGPSVWCMVQRNQMPQKPVEDRIRQAGIWDLDKLGLGKNTMEDECKAYLAEIISSGALDKAVAASQ